MKEQLDILRNIAIEAGEVILDIYADEQKFQHVDWKDDKSPLTLADQESHNLIESRLSKLYPEIPILSEEGKHLSYSVRKQWQTFFLIDPLDGTKEFINRNGEFTVNIALVTNKIPVAGVVHAPAIGRTYFGSQEDGAHRKTPDGITKIQVSDTVSNRVAVRSKSHPSPEEDAVLKMHNVTECISVGSSLKFCLVAEGSADIYYRHGPTMEWDVAAGQAVLHAAGGKVYQGTGPNVFTLNKEHLLNGSFLCVNR